MVRPGTGNSVNSNSSGNGMLSLVSAATPSNSSGIGGNFNVHAGAGVGNGNKNPSQSHNCGVRLKTDGGPTRAQEAGRGRNRAASVSPARHSTRTAGGGSSGSSQQQLLNRPSSAPVRGACVPLCVKQYVRSMWEYHDIILCFLQ